MATKVTKVTINAGNTKEIKYFFILNKSIVFFKIIRRIICAKENTIIIMIKVDIAG